MEPKRKETIIKEIHHWKSSKLLPEQYCDFLLSLYTEGDNKKVTNRPTNSKMFYSFLAVNFLLALTVLVIYFTDLSVVMQIGLGTTFAIFVFYFAKRTYSLSRNLAVFYMLTGSLILFIMTVHGVAIYSSNQKVLGATVMFYCGLWIFAGLKWKMPYFSIAGGIGTGLLAYFWFR